jgi:hypothetical protein
MSAVIEATPYERPKLAVAAGQHFARMLEKAIARSRAPLKQIELKAN